MELSDKTEKSSSSSTSTTERVFKIPKLYSQVLKRPSVRTPLGLEEDIILNENPAEAVAELGYAKTVALKVAQKTKISSPIALTQNVSVPKALLDFDNFAHKPLDHFLHPVLMELDDYQEFWADVLDMYETCFPVAITNLVLEYESFVYSAVENHTLFYFSDFKGQCMRSKIDSILLETFGTFKTIEAGFPLWLVPTETMHNLFLEYGLKTLTIAIGISDNPFDGPIPKQIKELIRQLQERATVSGINELQSNLEQFVKTQIHNPKALYQRTHQLTLIVEETIKLGFAFISLVKKYLQNQNIHGMTIANTVFQMTGFHYSNYSIYLQRTVRRDHPLSLPEIVQIINLTSHHDIFAVVRGVVPSCSYFCSYLMQNKDNFPQWTWESIMEALRAEEQKRVQSLEDLIDADAEEALKKAQLLKQKKPVKSKGKGKKPAKKPVKKPVKKSPAVSVSTTTTTVRNAEPIDERERQFAILVVGEYLTTRILRPVLVSIGMSPESWSWARLSSEIESNLNTRLSSRKHFLLKSIEWVRQRNEIAHPKIDWFNNTSFLWDDLEVLEGKLGDKRTKEIRKLLTCLKVPKPKGKAKPLSLFGRPDLGITSEVIGKTLAATRLCQTVLESTVSKECQDNSIEPTLPRLKAWRTCLPFLTTKATITDDLMDAVVGLLTIRNELAHPSVVPKMVRTVIETTLFDNPDYDAFLSRIAKRD